MPNVLFTVYHYFTCAVYIISHNTYILKVDYPYFPFSSVKPMQWIDYNNRCNAQQASFVFWWCSYSMMTTYKMLYSDYFICAFTVSEGTWLWTTSSKNNLTKTHFFETTDFYFSLRSSMLCLVIVEK